MVAEALAQLRHVSPTPPRLSDYPQACANDPSPAGARGAAILSVLRGSGLRRAEAAALDLSDYDRESGAVTVRSEKGDKDRVVYAPAGARDALKDWIAVRGDAPGPLFYAVVKGGALVPRRLAGQAMAVVCANQAQDAGVAPFTPHSCYALSAGLARQDSEGEPPR